MRPIEVLVEAPAAAEFRIHLQSPPPPPVPPARCDGRTCPWWPYSDSKDFRTNASIILIILFSLLLFVLALIAAIRYFFRRAEAREVAEQQQQLPKAADLSDGVDGKSSDFPTVQVFVRGMKLAGEGDCAICLSEFVEGDGIKVLDRCNHGFHFECIQIWLDSHSSCPTCRSDCLPAHVITPPELH